MGYRFVTITPAAHRVVNARPENAQARSLEDVFGWSRPFHRDVLDRGLFDIALAAGVLQQDERHQGGLWRSLVRASTLKGMILLHSAFPTEAVDAVFFGPDTYRFADAIVQHLAARSTPIRRALDVGCGSGAGGLLVGRTHPAADILLTDVNEAALAAARVNAHAAAVTNAQCRCSDLFEAVDGHFDLIVANPPYLVDAGKRRYRHGGGPLGGAVSLRIAQEAMPHLAPGGSLVLYTGSAIVNGRDLLLEAFEGLLEDNACRWRYREVDPDVFGEELRAAPYDHADRIATVVLTVDRP